MVFKEDKMKNTYDGILSFQGQWRNYQERVLSEADRYLEDGKIHVVAAPGAGKTTLGIELIRRTGQPCLILSPRLVIRQQWLQRIEDSFLAAQKGEPQEDVQIVSNDIRQPGLITSITYQTLFCGMTGQKDIEETEDETEKEEIDFSGFAFVQKVKEAGIRTICLDECHHLKNEWWKALENFMEQMPDVTVISLTATPPYDSTPSQWERYTKMCGPVDAEITIPELVKEGSLCPHQDYVWFNYPSREEEQQILSFRRNADEMFGLLMEDMSLKEAAASHPALLDYENFYDSMLENPGYLSALLTYCQARGISFSWKWLEVLNVKQMPEMSEKWLELFLQGFLYDDKDKYSCTDEYREALIKELKAKGLLDQKKVRFLVSDRVEKLLINSRGKLDSILHIASCEHSAMGGGLRMLILTDYIRKEYRNSLGNASKDIQTMGVLPVFELLRRRGGEWKLGILCGSMIVIPDSAREGFEEELRLEDPEFAPVFRELTSSEGEKLGYSEVSVKGKMNLYTRIVTRIFERGLIQILIGTKSLLGEGWDSPGINSLILASTVGSYVLGNQMRGRAIRTCPWNPEKVSNIWHLVCLSSSGEKKEKRRMGIPDPELSEDYRTLERRMKGILCISYDGTVIENGIERLSTIKRPYNKAHIRQINEDMAERSMNRRAVAQQWKEAVCIYDKMEVMDEYAVDRKQLKPGVRFFHALGAQIMITLAEAYNILYRVNLRTDANLEQNLFLWTTMLFILLSIVFGGRIIRHLTPMWRFRGISRGMLDALKQSGQITSACKVMNDEVDGILFCAWLKGGTDREKTVYADALEEVLSPVENQRYLLCHGGRKDRAKEYFCVPSVLASSREKAELFQKAMQPYIGRFRLVYTRNPEGRKILLHARAKSFSGRNERLMDRKKKLKGALE